MQCSAASPSMAEAVYWGLLPSAEMCMLVQSMVMFDWPHLSVIGSVTALLHCVPVCAVVHLLHRSGSYGQAAVAGKAGAQHRLHCYIWKIGEGEYSEIRQILKWQCLHSSNEPALLHKQWSFARSDNFAICHRLHKKNKPFKSI